MNEQAKILATLADECKDARRKPAQLVVAFCVEAAAKAIVSALFSMPRAPLS